MSFELFATIGVGVETITSRELNGLGLQPKRVEPGRIRFQAGFDGLYKALIHVRTASRIIREIAFEEINREEDIYDIVRGVQWRRFFPVDASFRVQFNVHSSLVTHSRFWTYRIKDAICDRFVADVGRRPDVDVQAPDVFVSCYLENRRFSVGLDAAGEPLHMRGYRVATHPASLREHLAAAMVLHTGWNGEQPLHDPFCGSGTIPIEAAWIATSTPPSVLRKRFGCEAWCDHDGSRLAALRQAALDQVRELPAGLISGADHDIACVKAARDNCLAAGFDGQISWRNEPVRQMQIAANAVVVTNPPYGERLDDGTELPCYQDLREAALRHPGSRLAVINAHEQFERTMALRPHKRNRLNNGPIPCTFYQYLIGPPRERGA